jgi:hypothetical protein
VTRTVEVDDEDPLWKPGQYGYDGLETDGFWCVRVDRQPPSGGVEVRWMAGMRTYVEGTAHRLRFRSRLEAKKWYWDTRLAVLQSKDEGLGPERVVLVHVARRVRP